MDKISEPGEFIESQSKDPEVYDCDTAPFTQADPSSSRSLRRSTSTTVEGTSREVVQVKARATRKTRSNPFIDAEAEEVVKKRRKATSKRTVQPPSVKSPRKSSKPVQVSENETDDDEDDEEVHDEEEEELDSDDEEDNEMESEVENKEGGDGDEDDDEEDDDEEDEEEDDDDGLDEDEDESDQRSKAKRHKQGSSASKGITSKGKLVKRSVKNVKMLSPKKAKLNSPKVSIKKRAKVTAKEKSSNKKKASFEVQFKDFSKQCSKGIERKPFFASIGDNWYLQYAYYKERNRWCIGVRYKKGTTPKEIMNEVGFGAFFDVKILENMAEAMPEVLKHVRKFD